jgi:hypothetical protein
MPRSNLLLEVVLKSSDREAKATCTDSGDLGNCHSLVVASLCPRWFRLPQSTFQTPSYTRSQTGFDLVVE